MSTRVLVTGSGGFIGRNLCAHLREQADIEVITFDKEDKLSKISDNAATLDFVVHLAGINRPLDPKEFLSGNTGLTSDIISILKKQKKPVPIIFSSSTQAALDNDYGKSKKLAEDAVLEYGNGSLVYRLHNVFGKWCRPNYNSVIATFCNNIASDTPITIDDPGKTIELIYIDDICAEFLKIISGQQPAEKTGEYCFITPRYVKSLGEIARQLQEFKKNQSSVLVPTTGDEFIKKLYATYLSYNSLSQLSLQPESHTDARGSFSELVHTADSGQISISTTKPGITRGNHYHHTKIEKFIVISGQARIGLRQIDSENIEYIDVSGDRITEVTIPPGYTHNITNTGKDDLILVIWANELFNKDAPDTYQMEVEK